MRERCNNRIQELLTTGRKIYIEDKYREIYRCRWCSKIYHLSQSTAICNLFYCSRWCEMQLPIWNE